MHLNTAINPERDLEEAGDTLTHNIKAPPRLATPNPVQRTTAAKIPITREILLLIADKRRLRTRWMRSCHPLDKADWNSAKGVLHRTLVEHKSAWFDDRQWYRM